MSSEASASPSGGGSSDGPTGGSGAQLRLQIKTLKGAPFFVTLPAHSSVSALMSLIESEQGVAVGSQRLICKGKVLKADKMVADYAVEDGDCLHLIVKSEAPAAATPAAAAPSAEAAGAGAGAAAAAAPMPVLTPNNAIPPANPPAFGFGPVGFPPVIGMPAAGQQQSFTFQLPLGGAGAAGQPVDLGALINGLLGGLQPQPAAQQQAQQQQPAQTPQSGASPAAAAASPPAAGQPNVAAAGPASPPPAAGAAGAGVGAAAGVGAGAVHHVHMHPQSHPALSVNAVRGFLTEVAQNVPRLSAQPPLSMDMRATAVPAAVQTADFPENLHGLVQLLAQTQSVLTGVAPPLLHRMQRELAHLTEPISAHPPADSQPDGPAQRMALQAQLRNLAFGLRRVGDSLRGLATLLEAVQVNPQSGEASLLILPPHLQPGRQINVGQAPVLQMVPNQIHVQGPNGPILLNVAHGQPMAPGQVHFAMQQQPQQPAAPAAQQAAEQAAAPAPVPAPAAVPAAAPAPAAAPTPALAAAAAPAAGAPANPLMSMLQQFAGGAAPAAGGAAGQPAGGFNFQQLFQQAAPLVGPLMQNLNLSAAGSGAGPEGQPQPPNPMAGIMQALGPMFANLQAQPPQQQQQQQQAAQAPVPAPAAAAPAAEAPAAVPPPQPQAAPVAPVALPSGPAGGNAAAPNFGNMLNSLMPMLGGLMSGGGAGAGGSGSLQDMMQSLLGGAGGGGGAGAAVSPVNRAAGQAPMDEGEEDGEGEGEEAASLVDMLLAQVMQHLSLPDMFALVQGNWSGMDRLHGPLREMLYDLLQDDDAPANRALLATSFATGIVESALDERALASVAAQRIPDGPDPARVSYPIVLKHVRALIDLVLDLPVTPVPPPPQPLPAPTADSFSTKLKSWCNGFVGEWLVELGSCFRDGVTSSQQLATSLMQQKLGGVGDGSMAFLAPMLSSTVGSVMTRCAQQYQQNRMLAGDAASGEAQWLQLLPPEDRARWQRTIEADEQRLQQQLEERNRREVAPGAAPLTTLYRPLSNAYQSGGGKRKAPPTGSAAAATGASSSAAAAAAPASSSEAISSGASTAAPADTRISDQLDRTLTRSIQQAIAANPEAAAGAPSAEQVVASLPPSLREQYEQQVAADLRTAIDSRFAGDFSAQQFPNIARNLMPDQAQEKK